MGKEARREYYCSNREKMLEYSKKYRIANRQKVKDRLTKWRRSNPASVSMSRKKARLKMHHRRLAILQRYKVIKGCSKCGYKKCPAGLAFHHKDPSSKEFKITSHLLYNRSWSVIKAETKKCLVLCNNCHAEEHWKEKDDGV